MNSWVGKVTTGSKPARGVFASEDKLWFLTPLATSSNKHKT
jgi:hypothetical protein